MMSTIEVLLQELEQEAQTTRRVLERVPGDRLHWKPHEKSMSLGQLGVPVPSIYGPSADENPFVAQPASAVSV